MNQDIKCLATILQDKKHVIAFTGAGISTESGIPDFRSKGEGLWEKINPEILSTRTLQRDPELFYKYFDMLENCVRGKQPNQGHTALAQLEKLDIIKAVVTQNIDGLHQAAGTKRVLEVHGNLTKCHCAKCGQEYSYDVMRLARSAQAEPKSACCRAKMRPSVVLFGDTMPQDFMDAQQEAVRADFVLAIGTSLTVYPAAQIPQTVGDFAIINREKTALDGYARLVINKPIGETLNELVKYLQLK